MVTELCLPILCVIKALTNLRRLFDHQHPDSNSSFIIDHREKKWALTENLQIHAKKLKKLLLNPEGCSYRRLCKQGNEGRKKRKIVNKKHLKVSKTYTYPSNDVTRALLKLIIWQAVVQMYPIL